MSRVAHTSAATYRNRLDGSFRLAEDRGLIYRKPSLLMLLTHGRPSVRRTRFGRAGLRNVPAHVGHTSLAGVHTKTVPPRQYSSLLTNARRSGRGLRAGCQAIKRLESGYDRVYETPRHQRVPAIPPAGDHLLVHTSRFTVDPCLQESDPALFLVVRALSSLGHVCSNT